MTTLDAVTASLMIAAASRRLAASADDLSRLDAVSGDGDHGVNMAAAFAAAESSVAEAVPATPGDAFLLAGHALGEAGGGSAGVLFGAFFASVGTRLGGEASPSVADVVDALEIGARDVAQLGRSARGDKTMLDALGPAIDAARESCERGAGLAAVVSAAAEAAATGAASTVDMPARAGRARYAEGGGVGTRDPGAESVALMFGAWSDVLANGARS